MTARPAQSPTAASPDARAALPPGAIATALVVALAAFMQMLDSSIIGTALPQIGGTFGVGPVEVGQGIVVYVLAASMVIPASAWIADRIGARRAFVLAMAGFTLASLLCGLATSLSGFVAARAVQGATGALMGAIGQLTLVRSADRSTLLRLMNISGIPMLVAPVLGPPLGGFLTQAFGWPWIFFVNIPVGLLGVATALAFLRELPVTRRPFDGAGFALNATALALLLFGLERVTDPPSRPLAIAALAIGAVTGWLAIRHLRRSEHPILSLAPLNFATFRIAVAATLPLIRLPIGALLFVLPILLQVGFGMSAVTASLALLAHAAGDLMMKPSMSAVFRRFGYRRVLIASTAGTALGIGACGLFTATTPFAAILAVAFLAGCARSFVMTGLNTLAFDEVPKPLAPSAVTLNQIVLQIAAALSVALATILFDASGWLRHAGSAAIGAQDCRDVLLAMAAIGLLALPVLARLPRTAGDRLSGRAPLPPIEE